MNYKKDILLGGLTQSFEFGKVECQDGFRMSVQASQHHYCTPRVPPYSCVEVGFPNRPESLLASYSEVKGRWIEGEGEEDTYEPYSDAELLWNTPNQVFPFIPIEIVLSVIEKHGGIKKPITNKGGHNA